MHYYRPLTDDEMRVWKRAERAARFDAAFLWFTCLGLPVLIVATSVYGDEIILGLGAALNTVLDSLIVKDNA